MDTIDQISKTIDSNGGLYVFIHTDEVEKKILLELIDIILNKLNKKTRSEIIECDGNKVYVGDSSRVLLGCSLSGPNITIILTLMPEDVTTSNLSIAFMSNMIFIISKNLLVTKKTRLEMYDNYEQKFNLLQYLRNIKLESLNKE